MSRSTDIRILDHFFFMQEEMKKDMYVSHAYLISLIINIIFHYIFYLFFLSVYLL